MSHSLFYYEPFYDIERFFEAYSPPPNNGSVSQARRELDTTNNNAIRPFKPRMDLHESSKDNLVTATFELPGLKKDDVNIDLQNGRLTISAETKTSEDHDHAGYAVKERRFGKVSRTLQLPQGVKEEEIKASMEHGVLTVTFPKTAPELSPKKISIA